MEKSLKAHFTADKPVGFFFFLSAGPAMLLSEAWPDAPQRITPSNGKPLSATKDI